MARAAAKEGLLAAHCDGRDNCRDWSLRILVIRAIGKSMCWESPVSESPKASSVDFGDGRFWRMGCNFSLPNVGLKCGGYGPTKAKRRALKRAPPLRPASQPPFLVELLYTAFYLDDAANVSFRQFIATAALARCIGPQMRPESPWRDFISSCSSSPHS